MNEAQVEAYLTSRRCWVEDALERELAKAEKTAPGGGGVQRLLAAMRYSLMAGGKRLRPLLFLAALESLGGRTAEEAQSYLPFAAGIEMLHTYSLIHDDLPAMDDDDMRRGRPSCHKQFDEATAILAGDGLLTHCFCCLLAAPGEPELVRQAAQYFAWQAGLGGMVSGQALDLAAEEQPPDIAGLRNIHAAKTGALLAAAVVTGGILAGADEEERALLELFGYQFGMAFQITDDILDVTGDEAKLGKHTGSDAANGKVTYVSLLGLQDARQEADAVTRQAMKTLEPLGGKGELLRGIAAYCLKRDC